MLGVGVQRAIAEALLLEAGPDLQPGAATIDPPPLADVLLGAWAPGRAAVMYFLERVTAAALHHISGPEHPVMQAWPVGELRV